MYIKINKISSGGAVEQPSSSNRLKSKQKGKETANVCSLGLLDSRGIPLSTHIWPYKGDIADIKGMNAV